MIALDKLDITYRQGRTRPRCENFTGCTTIVDMNEEIDLDSIRANLRRVMSEKGAKPTTLSLQISNSKTLVADLLTKNKDVQVSTLVKLAGALNVEIEELLSRPRVSIAGYVGAGGQIIFDDFGAEPDFENTVPRPPGVSGTLVAAVVRGDSMYPRFKDGEIIYWQKDHDGILAEYIGEDCVVRLLTGEIYVKQLAVGSQPGRFTLRSTNASDMVDVEIDWAAPVVFMMPRRSRQMLP